MAVMLLAALCACGSSGAQGNTAVDEFDDELHMLFDKYDQIIWALEDKNYNYAIQEIVRMSNEGREDLTSMEQIFQAEWYPEKGVDGEVPSKITVNVGGAVDIDGKAYTFLLEHSDSESLWGWLMEDGTCRYQVNLNYNESWATPRLTLYSARESADGYRSEDWLATYFNDAMLPWLLMSWRNFSDDGVMDDYISLDYEDAQINDEEVDWTVTAIEGQNITVDIGIGAYTATLELRGDLPLLTLTENATGNTACYYNSNLGYDRSWPEFIYPRAVKYLNGCLEDVENGYTPGFGDYTVAEEDQKSYSGNAAWKRLYELFTALGDYKDSAEIAARFTVLEDMYTGADMVSVDNMGNESKSDGYEGYKYNALGQIVSAYSGDTSRMYGCGNYRLYFVYDEAGVITKIQRGTGNSVDAVITPAYDSQGRMVSAVYQSNNYTQELSYKYDDQGRLAENIVWNGSDRYQYLYTYDSQGKLVKTVCWYGWSSPNYKQYRYTTDYTYDAQGNLVKQVEVEESYSYNSWDKTETFYLQYTKTWLYTNDAQGRPVSADYTYLNSKGESSYASRTITYNYEDLYFFE